jgi:hypothetical protein
MPGSYEAGMPWIFRHIEAYSLPTFQPPGLFRDLLDEYTPETKACKTGHRVFNERQGPI